MNVKVPKEFLMVPMDPTLIEQVIMNLLENAWIHSGKHEEIDFYARQEGRNVVFYVKDYGDGIEPERMEHLFDGCAGSKDNESRKGMGNRINDLQDDHPGSSGRNPCEKS